MSAISLQVQIKSLEAQLRVLKAQLEDDQEAQAPGNMFADLFGILSGNGDSSEQDIRDAEYRLHRNNGEEG